MGLNSEQVIWENRVFFLLCIGLLKDFDILG